MKRCNECGFCGYDFKVRIELETEETFHECPICHSYDTSKTMNNPNPKFWNRGMSPGPSLIKNARLETVARSHNLRGLLDYTRKSHPLLIETRPDWVKREHGLLRVLYLNGNVGYATFADHSVCVQWAKNRTRGVWAGVAIRHFSETDKGHE